MEKSVLIRFNLFIRYLHNTSGSTHLVHQNFARSICILDLVENERHVRYTKRKRIKWEDINRDSEKKRAVVEGRNRVMHWSQVVQKIEIHVLLSIDP